MKKKLAAPSNFAWTRRRFLRLLATMAAASLLPACRRPPRPLVIAAPLWPGAMPLYLARMLGWLDSTQSKLIRPASTAQSLDWLRQGKADGAILTLDEVLRLREAGLVLAVILVCDISVGADMLLVRPDIASWADLKGRRIGVETGTLGALMLYHVLKAAGLSPHEVERVPLTYDQHFPAWESGRVEAIITYEPVASQILAQGAHRLFDSSRIPDTIVDVLAMRATLLDKRWDAAIFALVKAYLKGLEHLHVSPDDTAYRLAPEMGLPPEQVMATFRGLVLPDLENNRRLLSGHPPLLHAKALELAALMHQMGLLRQPTVPDELIRADYLPREID